MSAAPRILHVHRTSGDITDFDFRTFGRRMRLATEISHWRFSGHRVSGSRRKTQHGVSSLGHGNRFLGSEPCTATPPRGDEVKPATFRRSQLWDPSAPRGQMITVTVGGHSGRSRSPTFLLPATLDTGHAACVRLIVLPTVALPFRDASRSED